MLFSLFVVLQFFGNSFGFNDPNLVKAVKGLSAVEQCLKDAQRPNLCKESKPSKVINDSLVKNLSCNTLTRDNVLLSLQPSAFDKAKHLPLRNWDATGIQQCWGLAFFQRRLFYLSRFADVDRPLSSQTRNDMIDLISTNAPQKIVQLPRTHLNHFATMVIEPNGTSIYQKALESLAKDDMVPMQDVNSTNSIFFGMFLPKYPNSIYGELIKSEGKRSIKDSVEDLQRKLFFRFDNISLLTGNIITTEKQNRETLSRIQDNLGQGRLPLVVVRQKIVSQHVLLIKSIEKISEEVYKIRCYDSSSPHSDTIIYYKKGKFVGMSAVGANVETETGIYIQDEEDMNQIQDLVFKYYKKLCHSSK